jgi:hypothetical protein
MDELADLRTLLTEGRIEDALLLVDELDEMSREDKINKISSYLRIVLIHLIKQHAEQRSTRSWEVSVKEALRQITSRAFRKSLISCMAHSVMAICVTLTVLPA